MNTPARVEIDVNKTKSQANRKIPSPTKAFRPKRDETTEYRTRYTPKQKPRKAFEAEQIYERVKKLLS